MARIRKKGKPQFKRPTRSTTERGYGVEHVRKRKELLPLAYGTACSRCGRTMHHGQPLELDHDDYDRTKYRGMAHRVCNRRAAAIKGNAIRQAKRMRNDRW